MINFTSDMCCVVVFHDINELELLERQVSKQDFKYPAFQHIIGHSPRINEAIRVAQRVSKSRSTILLLGESGTGKGLFAKAIHDNSDRAYAPFVAVNIASIPSGIIESELFGYEEGAFTGAKRGGQRGKLHQACGGTIFLDEIGEMEFALQVKILHILENDYFYPVGSSKPEKLDVRIIAATNRALGEAVRIGSFRKDLYYRLNVVSITLPPLRDRIQDIKELVDYIFPKLMERVGRKEIRIAEEVYQDFFRYHWPGNIRELENVLERAINISEGNEITRAELPSFISRQGRNLTGMTMKECIELAEKEAIIRALEESAFNKSEAIKKLGIGRTTFYKKVNTYSISLK